MAKAAFTHENLLDFSNLHILSCSFPYSCSFKANPDPTFVVLCKQQHHWRGWVATPAGERNQIKTKQKVGKGLKLPTNL